LPRSMPRSPACRGSIASAETPPFCSCKTSSTG
jgi:hypothetical protein